MSPEEIALFIGTLQRELSETISRFVAALKAQDDASAQSLLENGRITIDSVHSFSDSKGVLHPWPILFAAIAFVREKVVRALVRLGASIDSFRLCDHEDGRPLQGQMTPVGDAIVAGNFRALSLCLILGANMSCVFRTFEIPPRDMSGLEFAVSIHSSGGNASLGFLLDKVHIYPL